jgi:hypothetical protein
MPACDFKCAAAIAAALVLVWGLYFFSYRMGVRSALETREKMAVSADVQVSPKDIFSMGAVARRPMCA